MYYHQIANWKRWFRPALTAERGVMFNKLKSLLIGNNPHVHPKHLENPERYNEAGQYLFNEAECNTFKMAHEGVHMQILLGNGMKDGKISNEKQITPWIIGFLCGFLDQVTQRVERKGHADFEMMEMFLNYHFSQELNAKMWACYIAATSMRGKESDPFYPMYEDFLSGAREGFGYMVDGSSKLPELAKKLMELKS